MAIFSIFEILKHRISFYVMDDEIVIMRIRHIKMNPGELLKIDANN